MLDEEILQWLMERREQELAISILMLQAYPRAKITPINPSFKASNGWAHKFMKRHKLVPRARTSMAQKLPGDLENRIVRPRCILILYQVKHYIHVELKQSKFVPLGQKNVTSLLYFPVQH